MSALPPPCLPSVNCPQRPGLPAAQYHADTLQILGNPDSSAIGMGRLLTALQTLLWRYPQHAAAVRDLFNQWRVGALISNSPASQPRRRCTTDAGGG